MKHPFQTLWFVGLIAYAPVAIAQHVHSAPTPPELPQQPVSDKEALLSSNSALPTPSAQERAADFPAVHDLLPSAEGMQAHMDDDPFIMTLQFDRLEWQRTDETQQRSWELQGWAGGLGRRVWLRSKGEYQHQRVTNGNIELFWSQPTGPWWDALIGIRHDFGERDTRDWLAIGLQGLAPYKFEVAATLYIGEDEQIAARAQIQYDVLLTNRLILQPRVESNYYNRGDSERNIHKGVINTELGLRLRYEWRRQVAPYIGFSWSRTSRNANSSTSDASRRTEQLWIAGIHFWF